MSILLVAAVVFVMVSIVVVSILMGEPQKSKGDSQQRDLAKQARAYVFLDENFLTRKTFRKIVEQLSNLSIYSVLEVRGLAIEYYRSAMGISVSTIILGIFVFQDVIAVLFCVVFAGVLFNTLIIKKVDSTHYVVLQEFSSTLASIRETYVLTGNIPDAIHECAKGKHLQKAMEKIYLILTATDAEERLEDFYMTVPFPMLQTLAGLCFVLSDAGDEKDDRGESAFKSAITLLKTECDSDVRKLVRQNKMFSMLEWLPLAPLLCVGVLRYFMTTQLPGTSVIYNGIYGYVAQSLIVLLSMVCYWYITSVTSITAIRRCDRSSLIDKFLYWKPFQKFLPSILPKKASVKMKINQMLKGALSDKDIKYIYASKVLAATSALVITFMALCVFTSVAREFAYDNIRSSTLSGGSKMTVEDAEIWRELDSTILAKPSPPRERDLQRLIPEYFPDISAMDLKEQIDRITKKYNSYHNARFHWWYVLVAFGAAGFAWCVPELLVLKRKKLVRDSEEEDVLQLQTMLFVLRYTQLQTMDALFWLCRQSRIHKSAISFAFHEYPSDPELALTRLRDKSQLVAFKQICDRLMSTVSQVTIREAFSDLESERDHMLRVREIVQETDIKRKRTLCSPISRIPLYTLVLGYFLGPICLLVYSEGASLMKQIGM